MLSLPYLRKHIPSFDSVGNSWALIIVIKLSGYEAIIKLKFSGGAPTVKLRDAQRGRPGVRTDAADAETFAEAERRRRRRRQLRIQQGCDMTNVHQWSWIFGNRWNFEYKST